eukprot:CAMPEP_0116875890 /NCGR_PEP_ID=MMETSP0463-20121206/7999_1 /TAXON_ID=181622 /ORGANISM="Strombidinopsis sp, Strain SopsisLIS2011" /LENGTH=88 /DNA_ID=CAMNT_0004522281 /DNA_START=1012 /DNA_END=1278 /DNA_ORIENTATION=-
MNISIIKSLRAVAVVIQSRCISSIRINKAPNRSNQRLKFILETFAELKGLDASKTDLLTLCLTWHIESHLVSTGNEEYLQMSDLCVGK